MLFAPIGLLATNIVLSVFSAGWLAQSWVFRLDTFLWSYLMSAGMLLVAVPSRRNRWHEQLLRRFTQFAAIAPPLVAAALFFAFDQTEIAADYLLLFAWGIVFIYLATLAQKPTTIACCLVVGVGIVGGLSSDFVYGLTGRGAFIADNSAVPIAGLTLLSFVVLLMVVADRDRMVDEPSEHTGQPARGSTGIGVGR